MAFDFDMGGESSFYRLRRIGEIQPDDSEIQIIGFAKKVNASMEFEISDNSGNIQVRDIPEAVEKIEEGKIYRVLGEHSMDGIGTQYVATKFIQHLDNLDLELYYKTLELRKKFH